MGLITLVLVMLLAVVASGFVVRLLPVPVPLPLVQIALGAGIAAVADLGIVLAPEVFFLLFLPPLLFLDGWRIPKPGLFRDYGAVLQLALGLVVFTVLGMGFFIHWMIPTMPLEVAFALAAVLSPTDPIAVTAIAARSPLPARVMHVLEGESLLNDASGLVCLRFAVAALLTGSFSMSDALLTFAQLALGGLATGVLITLGATWIKGRISRHAGEEPGIEVLISLLIPFGAYLVADRLGVSPILAAVAAGITMSHAEIRGQVQAITRVRRNAVWDTVRFAVNGVIFVLMGEQLPAILSGAVTAVRETGHREAWWLAVYVLAITAGLAALRWLWVYVSLRLTLLRRHEGAPLSRGTIHRLVGAMTLAGVRGAITLAGILTLPLMLDHRTGFPARDLAIFLAAGVILASLIAAAIGLPRVLKGLAPDALAEADQTADRIRAAAARAAILAVERAQHEMSAGRTDADLHAAVAARVMELYRRRLDADSPDATTADLFRRTDEIERRLRLAGLRAERAEIFRIARAREIDDDLARRLVREIDLMEARYLA
jgi:CPA1 family monovalent cation:H+ antiporter